MQDFVQKFLDALLTKDYYNFEDIPKEINEDIIYNKVVSAKYRKSKISEETEQDIKSKINLAIAQKRPLKFSVPFGAYKAWKLDLGFRPDWAEVFNVSYLMKYASSILQYYPLGIEIAYTFSDDLMYFVSDIPLEEAKQYVKDFEKILDIFNQLDPRIQFHLICINDLYKSTEDFYIDFLDKFLDNLVFWENKYSEETRQRHYNSAMHNLYLNGTRKIGEKTEAIQKKYFYYSALMTDAVDCLKERRHFNKNLDRIQLVGVKGPSKCINVGACETSAVHFWVGRGVIKYNKGKLKPYIFTQSKINAFIKLNQLESIEVKSVFSTISNNFKTIQFLKEEEEK